MYLAYDNGIAIGWCNTNDRLSYFRTGEFDLHTLPEDQEYSHSIVPGEVKAIVCFEISPEYRGKGIGTEMMRRMLKLLKQSGYQRASLSVQKKNYAVKMYRALGFEVVVDNPEEYIMLVRL